MTETTTFRPVALRPSLSDQVEAAIRRAVGAYIDEGAEATDEMDDLCDRAVAAAREVIAAARPGESRETSWTDAAPEVYSTPLDLDRLSVTVTNDADGERLARAITDARQFHEVLSRLRSTPPGGSGRQVRDDGRRPDGPGLSSSGPSPAVSAPAGASIPGADAGPSPGLLMSMAMRSDHAIAHKGYYDWERFPGMGERMPGRHAKRLAAVMSSMRQIWEEVVGCGFYAAHKEADYAALAADLGVTFTDSGHPIAARASDEQPKAEDPKGLSPQGASAADEVGAPGSLDQASCEAFVSQPSPVDGRFCDGTQAGKFPAGRLRPIAEAAIAFAEADALRCSTIHATNAELRRQQDRGIFPPRVEAEHKAQDEAREAYFAAMKRLIAVASPRPSYQEKRDA